MVVIVISDDSEASFAPFICDSEFPSFAIPFHKVNWSAVPAKPIVLLHLPISQSRKEEANMFFSSLRVARNNAFLLVSSETQSQIRKERNWFSGLGMKWMLLPNPNACILASAAASVVESRTRRDGTASNAVVIGDGVTASLVCAKIEADGGSVRKLSPSREIGDELRLARPAVVVLCLPPLHSSSAPIDASFFKQLTSSPDFVSVGHESSIDTEALTDALDSGVISSAYINLFGYPRSGPFAFAQSTCAFASTLCTTASATASTLCASAPFVVCRVSTDSRVSRAVWDMVHAFCFNKINLNIPEQLFFFEKIGRSLFSE
jgi:hypothetical protein